MKKSINVIWQLPSDLWWEYDWLGSLLSNFEVKHTLDDKYKICLPNSIIVARGFAKDGVQCDSYIMRFKNKGLNVGCVHLSDEYGKAPVDFYRHADFVFRNQYRDDVAALKNCHFFALGYKPGFCNRLLPKSMGERKYLLSFAGSIKDEWHARCEMLKHAKQIQGSKYFHLTNRWDDPNQLPTEDYADLLCNTVFALYPKGNFSVETFRVYEAMEAGAIPIVENDGGWRIWRETLNPQNFIRIGAWRRSYWRRNYKRYIRKGYWQKTYGLGFPCPTIWRWENLEVLLRKINTERTAKKIQSWWSGYKQSLSEFITTTVENTF